MSVGRPDPNARRIIPPDQYHRNVAEIQRMKAVVNNFEEINESGMRNFENLDNEERELQRSIQESFQRLQTIKQQKAIIDASNPRMIAEHPATTSRVNEVGTSDQATSRFVSHVESQPGNQYNSVTGQNFQRPVPIHQAQFIQAQPDYSNANGQIRSLPRGHQFAPSHPAYLSAQSARHRISEKAPAPPLLVPQRQEPPQWTQYFSPNHKHLNPAQAGPSTHYRNTFQASSSAHPNYSSSTTTQANLTQPVSHASNWQAQASSSGQSSSLMQAQAIGVNSQPPPQPMHSRLPFVTSSSGESSLAGALGGTSTNPPNVLSSSNDPSMMNSSISPNPHVNVTVPIAAQSRATRPAILDSVAKNNYIPPNSQANSTVPTASSSRVMHSVHEPATTTANFPLALMPKNPTDQQRLQIRRQLMEWAYNASTPTYPHQFFYLHDWRVRCYKEDQSIRVLLDAPKINRQMNMPLQEFIDHFIQGLSGSKPSATPSRSAPPANDMQNTSLQSASATNPAIGNTAVKTPVPPSLGVIQIQNSSLPPTTPTNRPSLVSINGPLPSPRQANPKSLARDIMFALGKKRPREISSSTENLEQPAKKHASEAIVERELPSKERNLEELMGVNPTLTSQMVVAEAPSPAISTAAIPSMPESPGVTAGKHLPATFDKYTTSAAKTPVLPSEKPSQEMPKPPNNEDAFPEKVIEAELSATASSLPATTTQPTAMTAMNTPNIASFNVDESSGNLKLPRSTSVDMSKPAGTISFMPVLTTELIQRSNKSGTGASAASKQKHEIVPSAASAFAGATVPTLSQARVSTASSSSTKTPSHTPKANDLIDLTSPPPRVPVVSSLTAFSSGRNEPLFLPSSSPELGFLPSPWNSPAIVAEPEAQGQASFGSGVVENKEVIVTKKKAVYVLVPPAPEYVVQYHEQIKKRAEKGISVSGSEVAVQSLKRGPRTSSVPTSIVGEEDLTYAFESQRHSPEDEDEREAVRLACSRLQELSCRWDGCDCKLNSVDSLIRHLNQHKPTPSSHTKSFLCRWSLCGQQVSFKDKHLEKHASLPLRCAYIACSDTFRAGPQLLKHFRSRHKDGALKPSAQPSPPTLRPLQPIPRDRVVPSYLLVTSLVDGEVISKERHELVGRWVARNINSSDQMGQPSRRRPKKLKNARSSNQDALLAADARNDYEFLTTRLTRYSTYISTPVDMDLSDLDSANISKMIDEGLILWGSEGSDEGGVDGSIQSPSDPLLSSPTRPVATHGEIKAKADDEPSCDSLGRHPNKHSSDDEDAAVEFMLTDMTPSS